MGPVETDMASDIPNLLYRDLPPKNVQFSGADQRKGRPEWQLQLANITNNWLTDETQKAG
jgi:hypothetical protein